MMVLGLFLTLAYSLPVSASSESCTGSFAYTGTRDDVIPSSNLQRAVEGNDTLPVNIFVPSGTLAMSNTTGLGFPGASTGSNIAFTGTRSDINAALATLTFTPTKTA